MPGVCRRSIALCAALLASPAFAGDAWRAFRDPSVQNYGFQWATIGDPGNASETGPHPTPSYPPVTAGKRNYKYRMSRTEVTCTQWLEFVNAYGPYTSYSNNPVFTSNGIYNTGGSTYILDSAYADRPVEIGWRYAARYVNWLHNGKAPEQWAFESGVYDTSTFGAVPNGQGVPILTDQAARSAGATFWIPNFDEWVKAVYYDPDRYGEGEGGYWKYPDGGDEPLVAGAPENGGETNAGATYLPGSYPRDVMSYPDVMTPWGLWDASGGASEWLEGIGPGGSGRLVRNSDPNSLQVYLWDQFQYNDAFNVSTKIGLRIASVVPAPGGAMLGAMGVLLALRRRRRAVAVVAAALIASPALAVTPRVSTEHGVDFVTVGAPGNRNMRTQERYFNLNLNPATEKVGRVNYRYRVGRTEVTAGQYLQFVRAFGSYWDDMGGSRLDSGFTGGYIGPTTLNPNVRTDYALDSTQLANKPIRIEWRIAAYFCNYLHNGAPVIGNPQTETIPWAVFASGAYDASTFVGNPNGGPGVQDQVEHSPGARFWIPSLDEWTKAAYFDPDRYADGNPPPLNGPIPDQQGTGGYWLYPHMSQNEPIYGQPEDGGEVGGADGPYPLDVGSHSDVPSPWGALDMMGSRAEFTESIPTPLPLSDGIHGGSRYVRGSDSIFLNRDRNDYFFSFVGLGSVSGLRLAAAIPAPSTAALGAAGALLAMRRRRRGAAVVAAALLASPALAVTPRVSTEYGQEYVTIGRPGNRAALPEERAYPDGFYGVPRPNLGRVNHRYRIATTEVTASQWLGFVEAYDPVWLASGGTRVNSAFTSQWIRPANLNPNLPAGYYIVPGAEQFAIQTTWRLAAQYVNWLHNGQSSDPSAFASGAYDTSTFTLNPGNTWNDQPEHSAGAQFWLPTLDEWTKAAHYDPDRYGEGQDGYWLAQGSRDTALMPGLPENGGETSAGDFLPVLDERRIPVGSYLNITSPWGLYDTSGGAEEFTETVLCSVDPAESPHCGLRVVRGAEAGEGFPLLYGDYIDVFDGHFPQSQLAGIRVAAAVPAPGGAALGLIGAMLGLRRRRDGTAARTPTDSNPLA